MKDFNYFIPTNVVYGTGRIGETGTYSVNYGKKALIVTGKSSAKTGLLKKVCESLTKSGITYAVFDGVPANPLTTTAEEGVQALRNNACDMVIGVGGGSPMDTAKAIAFMAVNDGDISDYIMLRRQGNGALPIILIPTTAGTGSEGNCFAVLTNQETKDKKSLKDPSIFPKVSIVDPSLLMSMPKHIVAATGFDALSHNIEAYLSTKAQPISRILSLEGIKLVLKNLKKVYEDQSDVDAWKEISLASTYGGMSICLAGVGLPHAMEHPVSGLYDVAHGEGLAAIMPAVLKWNEEKCPLEMGDMCKKLDIKYPLSDVVLSLMNDIELNPTLKKLGVKTDDIDWLTKNCFDIMGANVENNPYLPTSEEVKTLYISMM